MLPVFPALWHIIRIDSAAQNGVYLMKVLLIGGTGTISSAITALAAEKGMELVLFNRGTRLSLFPGGLPKNVSVICGDIHNEAFASVLLQGIEFDAVVDFIAFDTKDLERDFRLFRGKTRQFIFISTASAYQKPPASPFLTESTPLCNPFWEYSRKKIAGEEYLMNCYRTHGFPVTIVRPSHTYSDRSMPVAIHGKHGSWSTLKRILDGKEVIIPGDGTSLWTLTHNTDFAKAFVGLLGNIHAIGNAYHITSDESLTWNQIYECIGLALHRPIHAVHIPTDALARSNPDYAGTLLGDKANTVLFDNSKIRRLVPDYTATVRFDEGARRIAAWVLSHPEVQTPDPDFDAWTDDMLAKYHTFYDAL